MIVTVHQPEHLPWLGLLAKVRVADLWVVLDNVAYRKNYFQNRNRVLVASTPTWLTVPVEADSATRICDVTVSRAPDWRRRYCGRLRQAVHGNRREAEVDRLLTLVDGADPGSSLRDLNLALADELMADFGVDTPRVLASHLEVAGAKSGLIRNICTAVGADQYLAGPSGRDYLDRAEFAAAGVDIVFFDFEHPVYPQVLPFVSHLSSVDPWVRLESSDLPGLLDRYALASD